MSLGCDVPVWRGGCRTEQPGAPSPLAHSLRPHIHAARLRARSPRATQLRTCAQLDPESLRVPAPPEPPHLSPSFWLSREEAVEAQLAALKQNHYPTSDHGIEVLYRFSGFDPWERSTYFGRSLDLGKILL